MGLSIREWATLSFLLSYKSRNSRISKVTLSNNNLSAIKLDSENQLRTIDELKCILSSLEKKGIIKVEEFHEYIKQQVPSPNIDVYKSLVNLNFLYILNRIDASQYEENFYRLLSLKESRDGFIPLTVIEKYIYVIKSLLNVSSQINLLTDSFNTELSSLDLKIVQSISDILQKILDVFHKYLRNVKDIIEESEDKNKSIVGYLYPFLKVLISNENIVKIEEKNYINEIAQLKESIKVEEEVINVLMMLGENERKIKAHREKLASLKNRLRELQDRKEEDVLKLIFPSIPSEDWATRSDWIKRKLLSSMSDTSSYYYQPIVKFFEEVSNLLSTYLFEDMSRLHKDRLEIIIPRLSESMGGDDSESHCSVRVSLVWMNDYCPFMMDSVIESEGSELTLCRNPECFVVYHKKCLDKLIRAGVNSCLVCGSSLI